MVLLQICSTPKSVDPRYDEMCSKNEALCKLIESKVLLGEKVVIWSFFIDSINEICHLLEQHHPLRIDGSTPTDERTRIVVSFQEDPHQLVLIANPAAAGAGITLHASHNVVFISFSNQAAHYMQSVDRTHRRGQLAPAVFYYFIICKDTIEQFEIARLRNKELQQHNIFDDTIEWPNSLDEAIKEISASPVG